MDIEGLIAKLKGDDFAKGFVEGVRRDASDFSERIAELETVLEIVLSVRMLDNLSAEQWEQVEAARKGDK